MTPKEMANELNSAQSELEGHMAAASPSNPAYGSWTDEEWVEYYSYLKGKIYSLEESLSALSP